MRESKEAVAPMVMKQTFDFVDIVVFEGPAGLVKGGLWHFYVSL